MVDFRCGFRANLFLRVLEEKKVALVSRLLELGLAGSSIDQIADNLLTQVALKLDEIVLPCVVEEIHLAKEFDQLIGLNKFQRYRSFWTQNEQWTVMSRRLVSKYPFLLEQLSLYLDTWAENLLRMLNCLESDFNLINCQWDYNLQIKNLSKIEVLGSDRHRGGQQAILIQFRDNTKLVWKPVNLQPELFWKNFVEFFDLPLTINLKTNSVLDRETYGWLQFVEYGECQDYEEVQSFYVRAGVLLALADSLNYSDGHLDNLIAKGSFPVLIDCETIFQSFGKTIDMNTGKIERSILNTGLVQKAPELDSGQGFNAALQSPSIERFALLQPHAIEDWTDEIRVEFQGLVDEESKNCPKLNGELQSPKFFVNEFVRGYELAYRQILQKKVEILKFIFENSEDLIVRQLVRNTIYYQWLVCLIQQPDACISRNVARRILVDANKWHFVTSPIIEYEIGDILNLDIPYFTHSLDSINLDCGNGTSLSFFPNTTLEEISINFDSMDEQNLAQNISILRKVLAESPTVENPNVFRKYI